MKWVTFSFRFFFFCFLRNFLSFPRSGDSAPRLADSDLTEGRKYVGGQRSGLWFDLSTPEGIFRFGFEQGFYACAFPHISALWSLSLIRHSRRQIEVHWLIVWVWKYPKSDFFDCWDLTSCTRGRAPTIATTNETLVFSVAWKVSGSQWGIPRRNTSPGRPILGDFQAQTTS